MTDLLQVLPDFDTRPYTHLLPSLDRALIRVNDLVILEPPDVAKRAQLPAGELLKLKIAVTDALERDLVCGNQEGQGRAFLSASSNASAPHGSHTSISTLDEKLDAALAGGIPPGYLVEVTGESGAGKTQLLLTLLLASQLPPPHGLSKSAIYISTEAPLATTRLAQLLSTHPLLAPLAPNEKPTLSKILSIQTPDLESQEHIIRYQLPVAIKKHDVGLVVLDSVAANWRAEFEKSGPGAGAASMAKRGVQLVQLGALLRDLARTEGIAVVVANQVADRFTKPPSAVSSNTVSRTASANSQNSQTMGGDATPRATEAPQLPSLPSQAENSVVLSPDPLALDHQQRWFTGWGDNQRDSEQSLKTPSLGLVWTNQLACRIALIKLPVFGRRPFVVGLVDGDDYEENHITSWKRWLKVVFAPWAPPSEGRGVEFELLKSGISHVSKE